jgi:UDP-N-acetylmuramoyl-L-alanyl-D-glutamate--2,6-diaminopimelate ligase
MEKYFEAKKGLFMDLGWGVKKTVPVVNGDDPWGKRLVEMLKPDGRLLTYGTGDENDVRGCNIELSSGVSKFTACTPWGDVDISMKLLGRYNISNALAAIASCGSLGVSLDKMAESLGNLTAVPGRLEEIPSSRGFKVFVDYAHTDDALEKVLTTLREITDGCLISVFGCGGDRDRSKRPAMAEVSGRLADLTVVTSDNPRKEDPEFIIDEICVGFPPRCEYEIIMDRREAIDLAIKVARPGDIVLIAGKGHEGFQELVNTTIPFDDRRVVRECLHV